MEAYKPDLEEVAQKLKSADYTAPAVSYGDIAQQEMYTILRPDRRRALLIELAEAPDFTVETSAVADRIAEREFGPEYDYKQRKNVYINLKQSHIPLLERHDVVTTDRSASTITFGENAPHTLWAFYTTLRGAQARPASPTLQATLIH